MTQAVASRAAWPRREGAACPPRRGPPGPARPSFSVRRPRGPAAARGTVLGGPGPLGRAASPIPGVLGSAPSTCPACAWPEAFRRFLRLGSGASSSAEPCARPVGTAGCASLACRSLVHRSLTRRSLAAFPPQLAEIKVCWLRSVRLWEMKERTFALWSQIRVMYKHTLMEAIPSSSPKANPWV